MKIKEKKRGMLFFIVNKSLEVYKETIKLMYYHKNAEKNTKRKKIKMS